ncbi:sugar ABC transporter permease [Blautia sp. MSK17_66]|uniref:carbohydrate ABC transporter permease n=1 Tax=Blautia TaxID=572511 RepID=UPI00156E2A10|nr:MULTISPECIES: sugar ABC transporter permease [Blautia]MCB5549978.1 sugar ABC transporter permease [Blautia sp. MSK17_66]NSK01655.1 sugar ABC transporter permease [Blautia obeum]
MEKYYKKWFKILNIPAAILFVVVILVPFIMGVAYSFTAWRGSYFKGSEHWYGALVGFKNYIKVFHSQKFITSFIYTIKFTIVAVVVKNIISLGMALMVRKVGKGKGFFRTVFFFPNLLGGLAMGFIWSFIFQNVYSLMLFGEDSPIHIPFLCDMLQDPNKAVFAMAIMATWQTAGYLMLIYLNGLNNIPEDLYEAASIDGATAWQKFRHITVPMLMPAFTIVFFLTLSSSFKMLDENLALTGGDFGTRMLSLQILLTTRENTPPNYGMAQAQAVIFFILIAVVSIVQVIVTKRKEIEA